MNSTRTITFEFSYFNIIVDMWNSLAISVRQTPTLTRFKKVVRDF